MGKGSAIHLVGNESVLVERFVERDAFDEIRRPVEHRTVGAIERDLDRLGPHIRAAQHVFQPRALPECIPHRAETPLHAGHMRLRKSAPVA